MEESILKLIIGEQKQELTDDQTQKLALWRTSSEDNEKSYQTTVRLWRESSEIAYRTKNTKDRDWSVIQRSINAPTINKNNLYHSVAAAAALLIVGTLFVYQFYLNPNAGYTAYETGSESKEIELVDGSSITINAHSQLWVSTDFNEKNRDLRLEGEAYFQVAKNASLPFTIEGEGSRTEVVGTAFNLLVGDNTAELTVTEGLVSFGSEEVTIPVGANQSAILDGQDTPKLISHNLNRLSWRTGELKFEEADLEQVFKDLSRHYKVDFNVSPEASELKFTSWYKDAPLEEVLNELELILSLDVRLNNTTYQVSLK